MTAHTRTLYLAIACMGAVIALSNYLVQHIINDWLTWGAFSYPLCFLVNDITNRVLGPAKARTVVWWGFAFGVALSLITSSERIALASGSAFLVSQLLDVSVFNRLRSGQWWQAPLFSSSLGSLVDTLLFFSLAFAYTDVPWLMLAGGDFAAKALMFILLLVPYRVISQQVLRLLGAEATGHQF